MNGHQPCERCEHRRVRGRMRQIGLSIIELMVAMTIGLILIFGATQVYVDSRATYEVNETAARLQETAAFAMSILESDVRMSNYWGLVKGASVVTGQAGPADPSLGAPTSCGNNYAYNLMANIAGTNNSYSFGCAATYTASGVADTLTVRRASQTISVPTNGTIQICSNRVNANVFSDGSACTAAPAGQVNDLVVNGYYVATGSTLANTTPSLRRKALIAGPQFVDQEIVPGVEDLQVQFGIDPTGINGTATTYVNPNDVPANAQIVSVRIWLLVRAERPEAGFVDGRTYEYADRAGYAPNDQFRRLLVSRTINVRNALGT